MENLFKFQYKIICNWWEEIVCKYREETVSKCWKEVNALRLDRARKCAKVHTLFWEPEMTKEIMSVLTGI